MMVRLIADGDTTYFVLKFHNPDTLLAHHFNSVVFENYFENNNYSIIPLMPGQCKLPLPVDSICSYSLNVEGISFDLFANDGFPKIDTTTHHIVFELADNEICENFGIEVSRKCEGQCEEKFLLQFAKLKFQHRPMPSCNGVLIHASNCGEVNSALPIQFFLYKDDSLITNKPYILNYAVNSVGNYEIK